MFDFDFQAWGNSWGGVRLFGDSRVGVESYFQLAAGMRGTGVAVFELAVAFPLVEVSLLKFERPFDLQCTAV